MRCSEQEYDIVQGDCLNVLRGWRDECIDAITTDPPYGLSFMGRGWDYAVPGPEYWREVLRIAKPGAHLQAMGGTRTFHRLACAIEDAGWEIRDTLMWMYGQGFPKSRDMSKAIDNELGAEREVVGTNRRGSVEKSAAGFNGGYKNPNPLTTPATEAAQRWNGWGTALKPAWEPIILARKPLVGTVASNVLEYGTGGINVDGCRIEAGARPLRLPDRGPGNQTYGEGLHGSYAAGDTAQGRWPANVCLDEEAAAMLDEQTGVLTSGRAGAYIGDVEESPALGNKRAMIRPETIVGDSGGASRFFYVAKTPKRERNAGVVERIDPLTGKPYKNRHPTVKPLSLMRWLVRMITPPGGIVLDPFCGSGSTGCAAVLEGFSFVGIDLEEEHCEVSRERVAYHLEAARAA